MSGFRISYKILLCKLSNSCAFTASSANLYIKPLPPALTEGKELDPLLIFYVMNHFTITSLLSRAPRTLPPLYRPLSSLYTEELQDMFGQYGAIKTVKIVRDLNPNDVVGLVRYPEYKKKKIKIT
jgi:hypothetical protein